MYFPPEIYELTIVDYSYTMKRNPASVRSYMVRNPEWALETVFTYLDKSAGFSGEYFEMKSVNKKKRAHKGSFEF